jgi:hypothetical protein
MIQPSHHELPVIVLQLFLGYDYQGQPLTRGEGFSKTLRAIILEKSHQLETDQMHKRRRKEDDLKNHFQSMLSSDSLANSVDEVNTARYSI